MYLDLLTKKVQPETVLFIFMNLFFNFVVHTYMTTIRNFLEFEVHINEYLLGLYKFGIAIYIRKTMDLLEITGNKV